MSALRDSLHSLCAFLDGLGLSPPTREVWLIEISPDVDVDEHGRPRVRRADFRDPDAFEDRFEELTKSGFPWINMSCCGIAGDRLVVTIETPRARASSLSPTSVNFSGPPAAAVARGWEVGEVLAIT